VVEVPSRGLLPLQNENSGPSCGRHIHGAAAGVRSNILTLPRGGAGVHRCEKPPPAASITARSDKKVY
jgi:hypothetical protein